MMCLPSVLREWIAALERAGELKRVKALEMVLAERHSDTLSI